jgi:radical SAM protein with 4Fe4S-binding SPASM domain
MNKIYCPSMWKSVHVDTDGYLTPCCLFVHPDDKKTRITDVNHVSEVLHNEFDVYRKQMETGQWPSGCNQCQFAEQEGRASKREQDMWMVTSGLVKGDPEQVELEYLQLKTGRLCNLRCTICSPACSTSIATELLRKGELDRQTYDKLQKDIAWSFDLDEYKKLNSPTSFFRIDIAGGEPLMNKTHFEWLDQISNPENTQLLYNTNGTQRPTTHEVNVWKKFRGVWLTFSIDSYGEKFEALRVGAKWGQVLENLKYCHEEIMMKQLNPQTSNVSIVMTISKFNVMDVFELYRTITNSVDFNHSEPLNFNYLFYPENMACHNMSKEELNNIVQFYDENLPTLNPRSKMYKQAKDLRDSLESFANGKEFSTKPLGKDHRSNL